MSHFARMGVWFPDLRLLCFLSLFLLVRLPWIENGTRKIHFWPHPRCRGKTAWLHGSLLRVPGPLDLFPFVLPPSSFASLSTEEEDEEEAGH